MVAALAVANLMASASKTLPFALFIAFSKKSRIIFAIGDTAGVGATGVGATVAGAESEVKF